MTPPAAKVDRNGQADAGPVVHRVGREGEPVLLIDDATGAAAAIVEFAATRSRFEPAGGGAA